MTHGVSNATEIEENRMKNLNKLVAGIGLLSFLSVMPLTAQIAEGVDFTTSFPFYAGNTKLPAGSYRITETEMDSKVLEIQSSDGKRAAFVDIMPTESAQPHPHSDVTFNKYGDTEHLDQIWIQGQQYGMKLDPTKADEGNHGQ
jgi:hypothetical protein